MRPGGLLFHLSYHKMPGFDSPEGRSGAIFSTGRRPATEETDRMQTQQLQKNMKEKVKVFEDGGIRLLKKGQKGLVHAIFSRFGLVLVLLLLQFGFRLPRPFMIPPSPGFPVRDNDKCHPIHDNQHLYHLPQKGYNHYNRKGDAQ